MAARKAFPLRINPEVYRALRDWAEDELRSVNGQIEYLLGQALRKAGRWPSAKERAKAAVAGSDGKESSGDG